VHAYPGKQGEQEGVISCVAGQIGSGVAAQQVPSRLLKLKQELVDDDIIFTIEPLEVHLLSSTPVELEGDATIAFISSVTKPDQYTLNVFPLGSLTWIGINDFVFGDDVQHLVFSGFFPKGVIRTILLPNGDVIKVTIKEVASGGKTSLVAVSK
ncbi:hypothetical protein HY496_00285, partial [Candidatus Woesearchaeota archaeon]|nr:hypothetical protein [Candidatus Woesearchaeota archaeon]